MKIADPDGNASWDLPVPIQGSGRDVWFRAVQIDNGSNLVARSVR